MTAVYAIFQDWPTNGHLYLHDPVASTDNKTNHAITTLLGLDRPFPPTVPSALGPNGTGLIIDLSGISQVEVPCKWGWVVRMLYLVNA